MISKGKQDTTQIGGAGGSKNLSLWHVPKLNFTVDQSPIEISDAQISLESLPAETKYYYGNIGQDVVNQFDTITISFLTSSVAFKKN